MGLSLFSILSHDVAIRARPAAQTTYGAATWAVKFTQMQLYSLSISCNLGFSVSMVSLVHSTTTAACKTCYDFRSSTGIVIWDPT